MEALPPNQPMASQPDHGQRPLHRGHSRMGITIGQQYIQPITPDGSISQESFSSEFLLPSCRSARRQLSLMSSDSPIPSDDNTLAGLIINAAPRMKRKTSMEPTRSSESLSRATPSIPVEARKKRRSSMDLARPQANQPDHGQTTLHQSHSRIDITIGQQYIQSVTPDGSIAQESFSSEFLLPSCRSATRQFTLMSADSPIPSDDNTLAGLTTNAVSRIKRKVSMESIKSSVSLSQATPSIPAEARKKRKLSMDLAKSQGSSSTSTAFHVAAPSLFQGIIQSTSNGQNNNQHRSIEKTKRHHPTFTALQLLSLIALQSLKFHDTQLFQI